MSGWIAEVQEELSAALRILVAVGPRIEGTPTDDQLADIWKCYVSVEKCVAYVKLEVDEENAARFVDKKAYAVPDDRQAVTFAEGALRGAEGLLAIGDLRAGLKQLRESRNYLRMLLRRRKLANRRTTGRT